MNFINIGIYVTSLLSIILCSACPSYGYSPMAILPLCFIIFFSLLNRAYHYHNMNLTVSIVGIFLWFRLVLIPLLGATSPSYYNSINVSHTSVYISLCLCIYESLLVVLVTYFLSIRKKTYIAQVKKLYGNKQTYVIFILFALVIYFTIGRNLHMFEFAIKSIGSGERAVEELDANSLLIRQIMGSGLLFLFLYSIEYLRKKYEQSLRSKYVTIALVYAMLMICIITGERRTSQIYTAFCTCWLLINVFPQSKGRIIKLILSTAAFVLVMMSIYKHFNAFLYDSYAEAVQHGNFEEGFSAGMFDSYFYGINTIVKNVEFAEVANLSPFNFFYDIVRCIFGVNFFVPRNIRLTSETYNLYLYGGMQTHGYLLSSVGYGYIYFGPIFAPVATIINVLLLSIFENKLKKTNSIEMTYIWAFIFMRFGFSFLGSLPPLVSLVSRYLFFNGSLYFIAKRLNIK